jgi:hypothetical protein
LESMSTIISFDDNGKWVDGGLGGEKRGQFFSKTDFFFVPCVNRLRCITCSSIGSKKVFYLYLYLLLNVCISTAIRARGLNFSTIIITPSSRAPIWDFIRYTHTMGCGSSSNGTVNQG